MEQNKEAGKESVETNKAAEIKLDNLPKKLSEEESKNVTGGVSDPFKHQSRASY